MDTDTFVKISKDFVEGRIDIKEFYNYCKHNNEYRNYINTDCDMVEKRYNNNILTMVDKMNWKNYSNQFGLQLAIGKLLYNKNIHFKLYNYYGDMVYKYSKIIPDWLSDDAMDYVEENIIDKAPQELNESEQRKWIDKKIKETFKYKKRPPEFAQEGVWPQDENGNFLVFVNQKEDGDMVKYKFVNPKTKQEVQVEEFL